MRVRVTFDFTTEDRQLLGDLIGRRDGVPASHRECITAIHVAVEGAMRDRQEQHDSETSADDG